MSLLIFFCSCQVANAHGSEFVIKRDGTDVKTNSACVAESGNWVSPYDGVKFTAARDLDIDHMVPLKNAWIVRRLPNHLVLNSTYLV